MGSISTIRLWIVRTLSGIAMAFLLLDAVGKLLKIAPVMAATAELGYPENVIFPLGALLLIGVILYAMPKTSVIGALYLTAFLGGAVASHVRIGSPLFTHVLFGVYLAAFIWGGLVLRNPKLFSVLRNE